MRPRYGLTVVGLERRGRVMPVTPKTEFHEGDRIFVIGTEGRVKSFSQAEKLSHLEVGEKPERLVAHELGLVEVLLSPRSRLIGKTLSETHFRELYGLSVLGILRMGEPLKEDLVEVPLAFGDSLLLGGSWRQIDLLQAEHNDFLVLTIPPERSEVAPERAKAPRALIIVAVMLTVMTFNLIPNVAAVLLDKTGQEGCHANIWRVDTD